MMIIKHWYGKYFKGVKMIKRELYLEQIRQIIGTDFIKVIVGLRRCGKTSLLKSIMGELQNQGVNEENIIYISFRRKNTWNSSLSQTE